MAAAHSGEPAVVALLLDRGADIHARDIDYATPLHMAAISNEEPGVVALLLDRGSE